MILNIKRNFNIYIIGLIIIILLLGVGIGLIDKYTAFFISGYCLCVINIILFINAIISVPFKSLRKAEKFFYSLVLLFSLLLTSLSAYIVYIITEVLLFE